MFQDCSPEKYCKTVRCDTFILEKESDVEVKLSAHVQFRDLKERAKVCSNNTQTEHTPHIQLKVVNIEFTDMYLLCRILTF